MRDNYKQHTLQQVAIRLVPERQIFSDEQICSPEIAIRVMSDFLQDMDREVVCVVNLQADNKPINMNVVSVGSLDCSVIHPREVMKSAILSNANAFMLVHNHPSGTLNPSKDDILVTNRLKQAGELIGIPLFDHIIVGGNQKFFSFRKETSIL